MILFQVVYELFHTGNETKGEEVLSCNVGEYCISNMTGWCGPITAARKTLVAPTIKLAFGLEEKCASITLKPKLVNCKESQEVYLNEYSKSTSGLLNIFYIGTLEMFIY